MKMFGHARKFRENFETKLIQNTRHVNYPALRSHPSHFTGRREKVTALSRENGD